MCPRESKSVRELRENIRLILYLIFLVAIFGAIANVPSALTNWLIQWLVGALVGSVTSFIAGYLVETFTGDVLKKITLTIPIGNYEFSITVFAIVTFIVKVWLFGF